MHIMKQQVHDAKSLVSKLKMENGTVVNFPIWKEGVEQYAGAVGALNMLKDRMGSIFPGKNETQNAQDNLRLERQRKLIVEIENMEESKEKVEGVK